MIALAHFNLSWMSQKYDTLLFIQIIHYRKYKILICDNHSICPRIIVILNIFDYI